MKKLLCIAALAVISLTSVKASESEADTIKTFRLGKITVTDTKLKTKNIRESKFSEVKYYELQRADAPSLSDIKAFIPTANTRTTSMGETQLYVRGAGDRQLGLYLDGALLNVPWDNRFDLNFLPGDIIGELSVNKNASSSLYGINVLGGAIDITTAERKENGFGGSLKLVGGEAGAFSVSAMQDGKIGNLNYIVNFSRTGQDGFMMADNDEDLLNQNPNDDLRTNSYMFRNNFFARAEYTISDMTNLGLTFINTSAEFGNTPATNEEVKQRFWKYPERKRSMIILNGEQFFDKSKDWSLKLTAWGDFFKQKLDEYEDATYSALDQSVKDEDATFGSRITLNYNVTDNSSISYVFNSINSDHDKTTNQEDALKFTQNSISTGLQFASKIGSLEYAVGGTYDYFKTPKTGEYTEAEGKTFDDFGVFVTLDYSINENLTAFANSGRKSRFPTMRESYDEALNKFIYNPDLQPETGILSEVGLAYISGKFSAQASFFANLYDDMIEKVKVAGDEQQRKMRANLSEATITGVDLSVAANVSKFRLGGYITYMSGEGKLEGEDVKLNNKPEILSGMHLSYNTSFGLLPQIELDYRGKQYEDNIEIDGAAYINFRLGYTFTQSSVLLPEVFIRVNNVFDTFRYSQLGMPEAGRSISGGVSLRM